MKTLTASLALLVCLTVATLPAHAKQFSVLLFTKTAGWHHKSINAGVTAMQEMAERHHFTLDWHEMADVFADNQLKKYDAVVFLNTTADILNATQQAAMERFIQSGKGFVGIHSASDTEHQWDWYTKMVGRTFHIHPVIQTAEVDVIDRSFPGVERMPDTFLWTDEFYEFGAERIEGLQYILSLDESTYNPVADWGHVAGKGMGEFHPIAWYHEYDGGRAFYTGLGHMPSTYRDKMFLEHIYGGVYWAATGRGMRD
jgi:type 1 glutamine amidotransferase